MILWLVNVRNICKINNTNFFIIHHLRLPTSNIKVTAVPTVLTVLLTVSLVNVFKASKPCKVSRSVHCQYCLVWLLVFSSSQKVLNKWMDLLLDNIWLLFCDGRREMYYINILGTWYFSLPRRGVMGGTVCNEGWWSVITSDSW